MAPKRIYNYLAWICSRFFCFLSSSSCHFASLYVFNVCISLNERRKKIEFGCILFWLDRLCIRRDRWKNAPGEEIKRCLITKWFCNVSVEFPRQHTVHCALYVMRIYYPRTTYCLSSALAYTQHTIDEQFFYVYFWFSFFKVFDSASLNTILENGKK